MSVLSRFQHWAFGLRAEFGRPLLDLSLAHTGGIETRQEAVRERGAACVVLVVDAPVCNGTDTNELSAECHSSNCGSSTRSRGIRHVSSTWPRAHRQLLTSCSTASAVWIACATAGRLLPGRIRGDPAAGHVRESRPRTDLALSDALRIVVIMSDGEAMDIRYIAEAILQKEEDLKQWCSSSGMNVGRMVEIP